MADTDPNLIRALGDRYAIEREVGAGGMATVYLARDLKHDRTVALKVLRPELTTALAGERFPREIRTVAQFNHPHILSLYDSGEAGGFLYYVMPFVEGETLRERLARERRLSIVDTVRILREVADGLAYAHARGVVHRDIKPANILLSGRHAVVADFGIAKALRASGADKLTTVGLAVGTPQYMSPEQAMGESSVDERSDIYSVGLVAYEMLAGRPPFDAPNAQAVLAAQVMEQPADIRTLRPDTPAQLADAVMRCLAKDRDGRWQSAEELMARLETMDVTPSGGLAPTGSRSAAATARPRRFSRIGAAVAAIVLVAVIATMVAKNALAGRRIDMIGVMPIEDISGKDSLFVAGMHDALTNALTRGRVVGVAPRSVMMRYRGSSKTTREIADENRLDAVVETTVFRAGDVIRINVQFTDMQTSVALWSDTFERRVSDVLGAQTEMTSRIAAGVDGALKAPRP